MRLKERSGLVPTRAMSKREIAVFESCNLVGGSEEEKGPRKTEWGKKGGG